MDRSSGARMTSVSSAGPRTPVSYLKRKGPDNGMQSDLLKLLEDLGTDSPIKPMEDYGLPSARPSSLAQYDLPAAGSSSASDAYAKETGSSSMERRASEGMSGQHSGSQRERETPSPLYQHNRTSTRQGRGPTPPSGSSLSSVNSRYSASTQRSTESSGLTDSATLNSMSSLAITPEFMQDDNSESSSSKNTSSRYVPSAGRTFSRTVSAPIQMGTSGQAARDEYEELSLTNRKRAELNKSTQESTREVSWVWLLLRSIVLTVFIIIKRETLDSRFLTTMQRQHRIPSLQLRTVTKHRLCDGELWMQRCKGRRAGNGLP
jgi:hypothetical protein